MSGEAQALQSPTPQGSTLGPFPTWTSRGTGRRLFPLRSLPWADIRAVLSSKPSIWGGTFLLRPPVQRHLYSDSPVAPRDVSSISGQEPAARRTWA